MAYKKIKVQGLSKRFGKNMVLAGLDLDIEGGQTVGLVAPNGSGKTTLLKCLAMLIQPDGGTIEIDGIDALSNPSEALKKLSVLIDGPGLFETMTGQENLELFASLMKIDRKRLKEIKEYTKLGTFLRKKVSTYSLGMKQRLGLGIALMKRPEIILLDEPMSGLDPGGIMDLRNELSQLKRTGTAILVSSHQLNELEKFVDRVFFLVNGCLVEGSMRDLEEEYRQYYGYA